MIWPWTSLHPHEQETFWTIAAFLTDRLGEQDTVDWALTLAPGQRVERLAVQYLLTLRGAYKLAEPWASAWRLIEESWSAPQLSQRDATAIYDIQERLNAGDRSGVAVAAIVGLVAPRLKVERIEDWRWKFIKKPRKPKTIDDILNASLTSGDLVDLNVLGLNKLADVAFLASLANALETAVNHGIDIARRLGWSDAGSFTGLGFLYRAYYTQPNRRGGESGEPDAYHRGIAPSVKLLHAVVARISELDPAGARKFAERWKSSPSPVHVRLWASISRQEQITPTNEVTEFLTTIDQDAFWNLHRFPEISELRAVRFGDMNVVAQEAIIARIRKSPPRRHWPKKVDATEVKSARLYWSLRELRRIEVAGGVLPDRAKTWLDSQSAKFGELSGMAIDEGFPGGVSVSRREPRPDNKFDTLSGPERLRRLEVALGTGRDGWDHDPADGANSWINRQGNVDKVLADLEATDNGGNEFPNVWNRFGWAHRPLQQEGATRADSELARDAGRVLCLLNLLSDATLSNAIEGICAWLDAWDHYAVKLSLLLPVWRRLWPMAVEVTNRTPEDNGDQELKVLADEEDVETDDQASAALNATVGKLTGVFFAAWRNHTGPSNPFGDGAELRQMRDILIAADGWSGLLVRYRLIEYLPHFLHADPVWANEHLIAPLLVDDDHAAKLWRAVARRTHYTKTLESIGVAMAERANDLRLGRETRRGLVFSLVVEVLHAFREKREPAVAHPKITQMLRKLDDEVRASAANAIQQFVREMSAKVAAGAPSDPAHREDIQSAAATFRCAAAPFLREVWPQERSLATPGVSGALADLPATAGDAFSEAVDTIERFLVPFKCWSMQDYGLYGEQNGAKKLKMIDDPQKASALLRLLDLTVGMSEGSVIPNDLADALEQVRSIAPELEKSPEFRRLATAARR